MSSTIAEKQTRIKELDKLIQPLADERHRLKREILEHRSKFKVGQVIEWQFGHGGKKRRGRVIAIREWCCGDPMWKVVLINKSGKDGAEAYVRDYNHPALCLTPT